MIDCAARQRKSDSLPPATGSEKGGVKSDFHVLLLIETELIGNDDGGWIRG